MSYTAYLKGARLSSESRSLNLFDKAVKGDKIFFLSLARGMCGTPKAAINAMLKKFEPFREAFECAAAADTGR